MAEASAPAAGEAQRPQKADTVARGATFAFAAKLAGAAFTAALTIFLARRLGSTAFGVFSLGLSIIGLVNLIADFGVAVALPRFLAEHRDDLATLREYVADGIRLELAGTVLVGAAVAALAGPIAAAYNARTLATPLRLLAIAMVGQSLLYFFSGVFTGIRRQALNMRANLIESVSEFTASVLLVVLAGGATAAAAGRAIGYAIGAGAGLALTIRALGSAIWPRTVTTHGHARRIVGYAATLWVIDSVFTIFAQMDSLLIGALLSAGAVGFFQAPMRLISLLQYPGYAIASAVSPRLARSSEHEPDVGAFRAAMRMILIVAFGGAVLTTVWADSIIFFTLGHGYGKAAEVLRALGPYVLLTGVGVLVSTGLNYLGGARKRIPIVVATVIVNLVVDVILIPRLGVVGGAVGSDVGFAIYVIAQFRYCARRLGLSSRPFLVISARCALAAVPMAALLWVIGTGRISVPSVIAGGVGATLLYGAGLLLTGAVSRSEVRVGVAAVRRRIGRRGGG